MVSFSSSPDCRCVHVTDIGLGYAATMSRLSSLSIRWCPQVRDFGIQTLCSMKSLTSIALSGESFCECLGFTCLCMFCYCLTFALLPLHVLWQQQHQ